MLQYLRRAWEHDPARTRNPVQLRMSDSLFGRIFWNDIGDGDAVIMTEVVQSALGDYPLIHITQEEFNAC